MEYFGTLEDARAAGYREIERRLQRGYITRRKRSDHEIPVIAAGSYRKRQLYYLAPHEKSTRYCYRVYLSK